MQKLFKKLVDAFLNVPSADGYSYNGGYTLLDDVVGIAVGEGQFSRDSTFIAERLAEVAIKLFIEADQKVRIEEAERKKDRIFVHGTAYKQWSEWCEVWHKRGLQIPDGKFYYLYRTDAGDLIINSEGFVFEEKNVK